MNKRNEQSLELLLDLNGEVFWFEEKYWTKIEATKVTPSREVPHGIKYSLTLHDKHNNRIFGMDNAHSIKVRKGAKVNGYIIKYDHVHRDKDELITPYDFIDAGKLLEDFWATVNDIVCSS